MLSTRQIKPSTELGKNASNTGETLLNQTGEVAKKIIGACDSSWKYKWRN